MCPKSEWNGRANDNLAVNFQPLHDPNSRKDCSRCKMETLDIHHDSLDDTRKNHDGHVSGTIVFELEDMFKEKLAGFAKTQNWLSGASRLACTFILHSCGITGNQSDKTDGRGSICDGSALKLCKLLTSKDVGLRDTDLFEDETFDMREHLKALFMKAESGHVDEEFAGCLHARSEALGMWFMLSSLLHSAHMLFTEQPFLKPTCGNLWDITVICSEITGQQRPHGAIGHCDQHCHLQPKRGSKVTCNCFGLKTSHHLCRSLILCQTLIALHQVAVILWMHPPVIGSLVVPLADALLLHQVVVILQ